MNGQKPKGLLNSGIRLHVLSAIASVLIAGSALAADSTCKYLADANTKIYSMPAHLFQTETADYAGGATRTSELIYLNNKTYVEVRGKWRVSPATPEKMREIRKDSVADSLNNISCRAVRDELVGGEAATLYNTHQQTPDKKIDSQIWISKSRGVPLKLEMDMDVGGAAGRSHRSIRYEYKNVQAPPGVQ
jgi:hypothetical protein